MTDALILFAHGARDPLWSRPFEAVAERIRLLCPQAAVQLAYLEFMQPGLLEAGQALAAAGVQKVSVVPMFLGAGGHVRRDLPVLMETLKTQHPAVQWTLQQTIGETPGVIEALALEASHALRPPRADTA